MFGSRSRILNALAAFVLCVAAFASPGIAAGNATIVDRSTPEALLTSFRDVADQIDSFIEALESQRLRERRWLYPQPAEAERRRVERLMKTAASSLDLSGTPDWSRESTAVEAVLMIREILRLSGDRKEALKPIRDGLWVVPGTYLQIGRLTTGVRAGDFVFTSETVGNVPVLYEEAVESRPAGQFDAYRHFTETPGGLIPPGWAGLVLRLPSMFLYSIGSNTVWQWLLFVAATLAAGAAAWSARGLAKGGVSASLAVFAAAGLLSLVANYIVVDAGSLTGAGGRLASALFSITTFASMSACLLLGCELIAGRLSELLKKRSPTMNISMLLLFSRVIGFAAAAGLLIFGISTAGVPVVGIVAGLGVGGLAVALATKTTLENLLAGVVLNLDGTVAAGDQIETKDFTGTVLEIGMRSTRLKAEDGAIISITNAQFADKTIKNASRKG